jgi:serine/threonine-protein kinase
MAAPLSLLQVLAGSPAASVGSAAAALLTLATVAAYAAFAVPRLARRSALAASTTIGLALLAASWALLEVAGVYWPTWPAVIALGFAQLAHVAGRAPSRAPAPVATPAPAPTRPPGRFPACDPARATAGGPPAPAPRPPIPAPTAPRRATLGRYRVDRQLGRGAMGAVYLGHDPKIGRQVAIKTMALTQEFDGAALVEARERFFREAETAGRLQHRDIVTIFDAGEDQDLAYIAMEYLKGQDLQRHTAIANLLPVPAVLHIVARVADALAYAHSHGVVHRDIKPANVMIDPTANTVKVTDFGIARITDSSRTRTGMVLGTPSFMSPEQMAGRRVDGRSDLYSLGVMLFQLLTGRLPHSAESMAKLMYQIANEPAPDVRTFRADLPAALADVIALALEKRPEVRYGDGRQFALDLRTVAGGAASVPPAGPGGGTPAPQPDACAATVPLASPDPRHNSPL